MTKSKYAVDATFKTFDERTGLPVYPRQTAGTEMKLRTVQKQIDTTLSRVEAALDRALAEFEEAFAVEDRKQATQARLDTLTNKRYQRRI